MKTFNPKIERFVRRGYVERSTFTNFIASMKLAWDRIWANEWKPALTPLEQTELSGNKIFTYFDYNSDAFDAMRQGSVAAPSQIDVWASMAAYRLEIPDEALANGNFAEKISFRLSADQFALGGLKVSAFLSDSPTPPS